MRISKVMGARRRDDERCEENGCQHWEEDFVEGQVTKVSHSRGWQEVPGPSGGRMSSLSTLTLTWIQTPTAAPLWTEGLRAVCTVGVIWFLEKVTEAGLLGRDRGLKLTS